MPLYKVTFRGSRQDKTMTTRCNASTTFESNKGHGGVILDAIARLEGPMRDIVPDTIVIQTLRYRGRRKR